MKLYELINLCIKGYRHKPDCRDTETGVEYSLVRSLGDNLVVCFNGTNDLEDWRTNFNFQSFDRGLVKVHPGYAKAYKSIRKSLRQGIDGLCLEGDDSDSELKKKLTIKLCGHSAGGAIAVLAGLDLANQGYRVSVYSFGSPAVGNKAHCEIVDLKLAHFRFYNIFDPVPYLPPKFFGYEFSGIDFQLAWLYSPHSISMYFKEIKESELGRISFQD